MGSRKLLRPQTDGDVDVNAKLHLHLGTSWFGIGATGVTFLIAVAALIVGAIALANLDKGLIGTPQTTTVTADGALATSPYVHYLGGTGVRAITVSATQLAALVGREVRIFSTTAAAHTVTLSGGATFSGGTTTIGTYPARIGVGLSFYVLSSTSIVLTDNNGPVVFS